MPGCPQLHEPLFSLDHHRSSTYGLIAWERLWRRAVLLVPLAATAAPIVYYYVLTRTHSAWATVSQPTGNPQGFRLYPAQKLPPTKYFQPSSRDWFGWYARTPS